MALCRKGVKRVNRRHKQKIEHPQNKNGYRNDSEACLHGKKTQQKNKADSANWDIMKWKLPDSCLPNNENNQQQNRNNANGRGGQSFKRKLIRNNILHVRTQICVGWSKIWEYWFGEEERYKRIKDLRIGTLPNLHRKKNSKTPHRKHSSWNWARMASGGNSGWN